MRAILVLVVLATHAHADVSAGGSIGAGAQGASTYSAVELRLDATWERAHVGIGIRGVWDDAQFRDSEWERGWDALAILRDVGIRGEVGDATLAVAIGALAPAYVGTLVDGYRVSLDDRWRTGVRSVARSESLDAGLEIDDMLDPALVAGGARWLVARPWGVHGGIAIDPKAPHDRAAALEAGAFHRVVDRETARIDVGTSVVAEISRGASVVMFASSLVEHRGLRFTARADVRAGTGSVGGLFSPLYRVERHEDAAMPESAGIGAGAGVHGGIVAPQGWFEVGARIRPALGPLYVASAGAPMGRYVQLGAWAGVAQRDAAGAAELRVAWAKRLFSALKAARMYQFDAMEPRGVWSLTAWFGASTH